MTEAQNKTRRRHSAELKQQILAECAQPGASVASVALSHGINANVVHKREVSSTAHPVREHRRLPAAKRRDAASGVAFLWLLSLARQRK